MSKLFQSDIYTLKGNQGFDFRDDSILVNVDYSVEIRSPVLTSSFTEF